MRSLSSINSFRYYGRRFSVDNDYYQVVRIPKNKVTDYYTDKDYCWIKWDCGGRLYAKFEVSKFIDDGIWVLI